MTGYLKGFGGSARVAFFLYSLVSYINQLILLIQYLLLLSICILIYNLLDLLPESSAAALFLIPVQGLIIYYASEPMYNLDL